MKFMNNPVGITKTESRQILVCCGLLLMSSTTVVKVQFLCSPQKRFIEVMANLPDCRSGTASSKCKAFVYANKKIQAMVNNLAQTAKIHGKFRIRLSLGEELKVNLQNWKDNGGWLPVLDAGGRKFESCFPDSLLHSSNGLGRLPFEQQIRVRFSYGVQKISQLNGRALVC